MADFVCLKCNLNFGSRNKLFKHLRVCGMTVDHESKKIRFCIERDAEQQEQRKFIYVVGGRLRGRTLSSVYRYSLTDMNWNASIPMRENRGSHGSIFLRGVLYAVGKDNPSLFV